MRTTITPKTFLLFLVALFLFAAVVSYAQIRHVGPGPSLDMVNMHQIQVLRAELAKLRVELVACHDELNEARKQLELCEKGATDKTTKDAEKSVPATTTPEKSEAKDSKPSTKP